MPTADEQVIVEGQRAVAVAVQSGEMIYSGGATDVQCVVNANGIAQRAIKVYNVGGWEPESQISAYIVQQLLMGKYQTQETVNANELVRNTADLNSFVLDLSDNTVLKKLTATGTADKVETGLTGVLVSTSAPFDSATSPQIDVSYTGLSRAALVNLFNSMPYNVGYTLVGSPTISNGVVSVFSSNDYLRTDSILPNSLNDLEFNVKFGNWTGNQQQYLFQESYQYQGLKIQATNKISFTVYDGEQFRTASSDYVLNPSNTYEVNCVLKNSEVIIKIYDNSHSLLSTENFAFPYSYNGGSYTLVIGRQSDVGGFSGFMDLNNTYIKINGALWFAGKAAMTKTCDVRGCTGTADLTADDKAIAEDKGWAITLS